MRCGYISFLLITGNLVIPFSALHAQQGLVINEFMAENDNFLVDTTDNNYEDWIEIYNSSLSHINLKDYFLTDNPSLPRQWPFPELTISPGEFLLVWADNDSGALGLHTNFKLNKGGEFLGLYAISEEDTIVMDTLTFGPQVSDISYGRFPDGSPYWQMFTTPTPAEPNIATQEIDSSAIIFDDTKIHNYELHFYVTDWTDSLAYYYEHGEEYIPAQLTYEGLVLDSIGVRYKGNSSYMMSRRTPKKPFKFKFDKYKKDQTFFGLKRLNFSNCVKDPSFMREKISYDIARQYLPAPRTAYANIYIEGELIGFYVQVEQIAKTFLRRYFEDNDFNLYKASDNGATLEYRGADQSSYESELELKTNEDLNDWSGLIAMIDKLNNTPASAFVDTMQNYLNLDNCIRHLAFNMVLSHFDSYTGSGRNYYLYDDSVSGQFNIIPWDLNEAFGAFTNNWDVMTQSVVNVSNLSQRPLNARILENESLKQVYLNYINEMINGPASYDSIAAKVEQMKPLIDDYVQADNNKLYSYQNFIDNLENDVYVGLGMLIPGIKSFSHERNTNLEFQIAQYTDVSVPSENSVVNQFVLQQNYPNPFNPKTKIRYSLPGDGKVSLAIYNVFGQEIVQLVDEYQTAGYHEIEWNGSNLSSGVYFCRLSVKSNSSGKHFEDIRKMSLVK